MEDNAFLLMSLEINLKDAHHRIAYVAEQLLRAPFNAQDSADGQALDAIAQSIKAVHARIKARTKQAFDAAE